MFGRTLLIALPIALVSQVQSDGQVLVAQKPLGHSIRVAKLPVHIARLIKQLNSDRFVERRSAETKLFHIGTEAVLPLLETSENGSHESRRRALKVLEKVYRNPETSERVVELIDEGFDSLQHSSDPSFAQLTKKIIARNLSIRRRRALAQVVKMGGVVRYYKQNYPSYYNRSNGVSENELTVRFILVGTNWTAGDEGVKYLKRIPDLRVIYIASSKKTKPLSKKAIKEIKLELPTMQFQMRGTACLGVTGSTLLDKGGCSISDVEKGSAAEQAGIKSLDVVLMFDGIDITSFEQLVELIGEHDPGEKIKMKVKRKQEKIDLEIVLKKWMK